MKSAWKMSAIVFLATSLVAQTTTEPKSRKSKAPAVTAAEVRALRDAVAAQQAALAQQQQQIQELRDTLRGKDQAVQQAQSAATDAAVKADAAQAQASQQQQTVGELKSDVSDLKTNLLNTTETVQETQKRIGEPPTSIHFKGITITPGGFLAAETVTRSRALASDINTPLNALTMPGASQSRVSEFFGSGRQSRISLLAQGDLGNVKMNGYYEADFLSAAVTSNNNQSNSYSLRQRQAFAQAAFSSGWTVTGGQMWSLVTETKKGTDNRSEALPMTIDPQYTVGFSWARQYGLRVAKNFGNKAWFAVSVEDPQATITTHGNANNYLVGSAGAGGGLYNSAITNCATSLTTTTTSTTATTTCTPAASYSFNPSPDVIAKLALEPGFGHYEVLGIYSRFRDRVFPCADVSASALCGGSTTPGPNSIFANNLSKNGFGIGANARWSFYKKRVDFGLHALGGNGVGRYGTGGLPDASVHANGSLNLVRSYQGLATLEWHGPKLDVYFNAGSEYAKRAWDFDPVTGKPVGYGAPAFSNSGCFTEVSPLSSGFVPGGLASCTADTRALIEGTAGFWHKFYDGSKEKVNRGRMQWGLQYSYVTRSTWSGKSGLEPEGLDNMFFTSFRYYLPQ
ncbi:MAG: hypothetical protein JWQ87_1239 [Candidatus Sulfotelmatobacter sp.]|nr:hypothetical protein [Candidatus Sulfotelmatobacter sp.]